VIGERGTRLSGGQRQRIGIARALYNQPDVLIMDEATSALDGETEREINEALAELKAGLTVIVIAHRLTTVRSCDRLVLLDKGRVAATGTFADLTEGNREFQRLAGLSLEAPA
jgi:ABC-type multidrug transport system fused ATPase/permease subunit